MRVAVVSDVHANLAALDAVLDDVGRTGAEELWCLGDLVGYGAEPEACMDAVIERAAICLAGNHDLVVAGLTGLDVFTHDAAEAARWTRERFDEERRARLAALPPAGERGGVELAHGSPRDPVWEYVVDAVTAGASLDAQRSDLLLVGHSHVALAFARLEDGRLAGGLAAGGTTMELPPGRALVNPGSVGQPRDGDPRAAWLVLDTDARQVEWKRVAYDVERAQAAIRAAGLPDRLAARLAEGI